MSVYAVLAALEWGVVGASAEPPAGERVRLGVEVQGGVDFAGVDDGTALGAGPGLAVPVQLGLAEGVALRLQVGAFGLVGHDRVEWTEQTVEWYSDRHRSIYGVGEGTLGVAFGFAPRRAVNPWIGVDAGGRVVAGWHTFEGGTASLRAGEEPTQRDTLQVAPVIGGVVGLRLGRPGRVAVDVGAGYSVSFLPEAPLGEVPTAFGASRTAFALDRARMGFGVSFPLV